MIWGPEVGVGDLDAGARDGSGRGEGKRGVCERHFKSEVFGGTGDVDVGFDQARGRALDDGVRDGGGGEGLEPDGLPDAADGGVPDAAGGVPLLAAGLAAGVGGISDADGDLVRARSEGGSDIDAEGVVTTFVRADIIAIDLDGAGPIDCAEVEHDAAISAEGGPVDGESERAAIGDDVVGGDAFADAGEGGFDGEGDEDGGVEVGCGGACGDGEIPESVEIEPMGADKGGAGVLGPDVLGSDLFGPGSGEGSGGGFPEWIGCRDGDGAGEWKEE